MIKQSGEFEKGQDHGQDQEGDEQDHSKPGTWSGEATIPPQNLPPLTDDAPFYAGDHAGRSRPDDAAETPTVADEDIDPDKLALLTPEELALQAAKIALPRHEQIQTRATEDKPENFLG